MINIGKLPGILLMTASIILFPKETAIQAVDSSESTVFNLSKTDAHFVDSLISKMSLSEKCAQMIMPNANGVDTSETSSGFKNTSALLSFPYNFIEEIFAGFNAL